MRRFIGFDEGLIELDEALPGLDEPLVALGESLVVLDEALVGLKKVSSTSTRVSSASMSLSWSPSTAQTGIIPRARRAFNRSEDPLDRIPGPVLGSLLRFALSFASGRAARDPLAGSLCVS
jgi:hypothetical protein